MVEYYEKMDVLKKEMLKLNKGVILLDNLDISIIDFLYQSLVTKKGYIFIYHHSDYSQNYDFNVEPKLILSLKQFEEIKDIFIFEVEYKIIPLLLSEGYFYKKLKRMTDLKVELPLITNQKDIENLVNICRKDNYINIWIMHPNSQSSLREELKKMTLDTDIVMTVDEELNFNKDKNYHVVLLLMTKGNHYHDLLNQIPNYVSVSEILPLQSGIKKWIEMKIK